MITYDTYLDRLEDRLREVERTARWYCVSREGLATLCKDERDARQVAIDADAQFPACGPHRAVRLGEVE